jgi:TonB-dependent starch-binding outer membrane protein SusC
MLIEKNRGITWPRLLLFPVLLFLSTISFAQNKEIRGVVVDSAQRGIPGVSVTVRGKTTGTVTDREGKYTISAAAGDVLDFSIVGYGAQQATVRGNNVPSITLRSESSQLADVVVIGYGTRQRKDVTGAVSQIGAKDLERSTAASPEMALQGKAAGVFIESGGGNPNARPIIRIRGVNSTNFSEPLYVIDGVPIYEGGAGVTTGAIGDIRSPINIFSMINPQDIESISVLKDASASAIYGVRASNGVILITTKRGRGRAKVDVNSSYGVGNVPKSISTLNTQQYFTLIREAYAANPEPGKTFEQRFGSRYDQASPEYMGDAATYNWQKELLNRNAPIQDHSVRLSGGNEGTTYYLSAGYTKQEGSLKANNLERYSVAANVESRISKIFTAGLNVRLVQQNTTDNTRADLGSMVSTIPFQPIYDPSDPTGFAKTTFANVIPNPDYDPNRVDLGGGSKKFESDPVLIWGPQTRSNVFAQQVLNSSRWDLDRIIGNAFLQIEPIPGLRLRGTLGGDRYDNLSKSFSDFNEWQYNQTPQSPWGTATPEQVGSYGRRQTYTRNLNKELTLSFNRTFGDHNIDVVLSASEQQASWAVDDLSGKVESTDPQLRGIRNQPPITNGFNAILWEDNLIGYMGRISYKFADRYYLDGTFRRDGSSRLAPGYKWDNFPSFAAAWRISSEEFFPKTAVINDLKIRAGWGELGNFQSAGFYKFIPNVYNSPDYPLGSGNGNGLGTQLQGAALRDFANTTLTWEKVRTTNVGFDAQLFNNQVTLTAEYYHKLTDNMIQSVALPPNTGVEINADLNIGQVKNDGFEFQVGYNSHVGPVNFSINGNLTTVKNKVVRLNRGTPFGDEFGRIEEGYPLFYLWGYQVGGIFQTQAEIDAWRAKYADVSIGQTLGDPSAGPQYNPGDMYFTDVYGNPTNPKERYSLTPDNIINSNDRTYLGKTIPGYFYGLTIDANYAGIDVSVFFQGVGDVQKYNFLRSGGEAMSGISNFWSTTLNRWTPSNTSTDIPRAVYNDPYNTLRASSRFVENAGYMRLRNVQVGYTLPQQLMAKTGFVQRFRLYVTGTNLFTATNWSGIDPENDLVPLTRQFLFGVSATF